MALTTDHDGVDQAPEVDLDTSTSDRAEQLWIDLDLPGLGKRAQAPSEDVRANTLFEQLAEKSADGREIVWRENVELANGTTAAGADIFVTMTTLRLFERMNSRSVVEDIVAFCNGEIQQPDAMLKKAMDWFELVKEEEPGVLTINESVKNILLSATEGQGSSFKIKESPLL